MDDRELLELAAKAAGYQVEWVRNSGCYYRCEEDIGREQWDPLEDDGDALRLAVKLGINPHVDILDPDRGPVTSAKVFARLACVEAHNGDPCAATRRAIARAAAEIGRAM